MALKKLLPYSLLALATLSITACSKPADSLKIEREVLLAQGDAGFPNAIAKMHDGSFVIAGNMRRAWATRVKSNGEVLWDYWEGGKSNPPVQYGRSNFTGVVALADQSALLCGYKAIDTSFVGYLVHIDAVGRVIDQRTLWPKGDTKNNFSRFEKCLPWGDGIAVVGTASTPSGGPANGWLIKLDKVGNVEWEKLGPEFGGHDAIETADKDLVLVYHRPPQRAELVRLNAMGSVLARRTIPCYKCAFLQQVVPSAEAVFAAQSWPTTTIYRLDQQLRDVVPPRDIEAIPIESGFILGDDSLLVLGAAKKSEGLLTAAIAHISAKGKLAQVYEFKPSFESPAVTAGALSDVPSEFTAVRQSVAKDVSNRGVVMTWVSVLH